MSFFYGFLFGAMLAVMLAGEFVIRPLDTEASKSCKAQGYTSGRFDRATRKDVCWREEAAK